MNKNTAINDTACDTSNGDNCYKCKGLSGKARNCLNHRKLLGHSAGAGPIKLGLLFLLACFFLQGQVKASVPLPAVGPMDHGQNDKISVGYLTVFSSTEQTQSSDSPYYYAHTGYLIYNSSGKAIKWVANRDGSNDEVPQQVELAPGNYTIWAQSDKNGYVTVPVVIKLARTTSVHLEDRNA